MQFFGIGWKSNTWYGQWEGRQSVTVSLLDKWKLARFVFNQETSVKALKLFHSSDPEGVFWTEYEERDKPFTVSYIQGRITASIRFLVSWIQKRCTLSVCLESQWRSIDGFSMIHQISEILYFLRSKKKWLLTIRDASIKCIIQHQFYHWGQ